MKQQAITVGVVEFLNVAAYVLIFTFLWRAGVAVLADTPLGRGMAAVSP
jgi:hypothetical protein